MCSSSGCSVRCQRRVSILMSRFPIFHVWRTRRSRATGHAGHSAPGAHPRRAAARSSASAEAESDRSRPHRAGDRRRQCFDGSRTCRARRSSQYCWIRSIAGASRFSALEAPTHGHPSESMLRSTFQMVEYRRQHPGPGPRPLASASASSVGVEGVERVGVASRSVGVEGVERVGVASRSVGVDAVRRYEYASKKRAQWQPTREVVP